MAESTIDFKPPVDSTNNPVQEREQMQSMNNIAVQMAMGMNLNRSMDNKLTAVNMNMGKVAAGLNRIDVSLNNMAVINKDMVNKMASINMNIGKTNARLDKIDQGIQQMVQLFRTGAGSKNTNMSIGNMSTRLASMQKHQEETNKLLQQIFRTRRTGESSKYEKLEADFESRSGDKLGDMSKTLVSIDNTLKAMLGRGGMNNTTNNGGSLLSILGAGAAGGLTGILTRSLAPIIARLAIPAVTAAAGAFVVDRVLNKLGVGDNKIDYEKDKENWERMNWMNKVESSTARIIENTVGLVMPSVRNEAQSARIRDESAYFANKDAARAEEIEKQRKKFYDNANPNKGSSWENQGRNGNPTHMDMAVADDVLNSYWDKKRRGIKYNSPIGPQMPSGENLNVTVRTKEFVGSPFYNIPATEKNDSSQPVNKTNPVNTGTQAFVGLPFTSSDSLSAQNRETEMRDKAITTGDMVYNAKDITYKATMIRFDAGTIMFSGGQGSGNQDSSSSQNSGSAAQQYSNGPTSNDMSAPNRSTGNSSTDNSYSSDYTSNETQKQLSDGQKTALDSLQKTGSYNVPMGKTNDLSSIPEDVLGKSNVKIKSGPHGDYYSYEKPKNDEKTGTGGKTVVSGIRHMEYQGKGEKSVDVGPIMGKMMEASMDAETLKKYGLDPLTLDEAQFMMGQFGSEGGIHNKTPGDPKIPGGSHGAGQWNRDRYWETQGGKNSLQGWAKQYDLDPADPVTQQYFAMFENQKKKAYKGWWKKIQTAIAAGDIDSAYKMYREHIEVGQVGGANRKHFDEAFGNVKKGTVKQGQVGLTDSVQDNMPVTKNGASPVAGDMPVTTQPSDKTSAIPGGAKVIKDFKGKNRPGDINEGIDNIGQIAATAAGMKSITYTSGKGDWISKEARANGQETTFHKTGDALDAIGFESEDQKLAFIENAVAAGANGIGVYRNGSVHIDTGPFRSWGLAKSKKYQNAIKRGMERRKNGDIPQQLMPTKEQVENVTKPYVPKPRPKPDRDGSPTKLPSVEDKSVIDAGDGDRSSGMPSLGYDNFKAGGPENTAMTNIMTDRAMGRLGYPADTDTPPKVGAGSPIVGGGNSEDDRSFTKLSSDGKTTTIIKAALPKEGVGSTPLDSYFVNGKNTQKVPPEKVSEVAPKSDWWGNYGLDDEAASSASMTSDMDKREVSRNYDEGRNAIAAKRRKLLDQANERAEMARRSRDNTERTRITTNEKSAGPSVTTQKADEKKTMHSTLDRHGEWYKQFAAQIRQ